MQGCQEYVQYIDMHPKILSAECLLELDMTTQAMPRNVGRDYEELCQSSHGFALMTERKHLTVGQCPRERRHTVRMIGDGADDVFALRRSLLDDAVGDGSGHDSCCRYRAEHG